MKQLLLICAVVALVGCGESKEEKAAKAKAVAEAKAAEAKADAEAKRQSTIVEIADPIVETAIRSGYSLNKPTGKLTKADMEKVTKLDLYNNRLTSVKDLEKLTQLTALYLKHNKLTDVKGLEKLTQLKFLNIANNPDLTKAQIDQLQKALPNCKIYSKPTK